MVRVPATMVWPVSFFGFVVRSVAEPEITRLPYWLA
jgi:hypothetical protein